MSHPQLDNLVRIGKLKAEPPSDAECQGLLRSGQRRRGYQGEGARDECFHGITSGHVPILCQTTVAGRFMQPARLTGSPARARNELAGGGQPRMRGCVDTPITAFTGRVEHVVT